MFKFCRVFWRLYFGHEIESCMYAEKVYFAHLTVCKKLRPIVQGVGFRHCFGLNRLKSITSAMNIGLGARIIEHAKNRIQNPYTILGILQTTFRC